MNNKYFTPEIEDLRIGYECEENYINENDNWIKTDLSATEIYHYEEDIRNDLNLYQIRTPFLTKEQVKQEGWVNKENYLIKEDIYKEEDGDFAGIHYRLYLHKNETLTIERLSINEYDGKPYYDLYEGNQNHIVKNIKIKSINEFRKLLKMLEI